MASYPYPIESDVFNDKDYIGNNDVNQSSDAEVINSSLYVHKSGDIMTGPFSAPEIQVGLLSFNDNSLQQHAFTDGDKLAIESVETKTQHITINSNDITTIPDIETNTLHFGNTTEIQTRPFTDAINDKINGTHYRISAISYYSTFPMTLVSGTMYANIVVCDNMNTAHLGQTTSHVQTQINDITTKLTAITYDTSGSTIIASPLKCNSLGFNTTNSTISQTGTDIIIKNASLGSAFKLIHTGTDSAERVLLIDQFLNMYGLNEVHTNSIISLFTHMQHIGDTFTLTNSSQGGKFEFKLTDMTATVKTITIDHNGNITNLNNASLTGNMTCNNASLTGNLNVTGTTNLGNNVALNSTTATARQMTASYYNFYTSGISTPSYVSRIYAAGGITNAAMIFDQTLSTLTDTTYSFYNRISNSITVILQLANNVILGAPLQFADGTIQTSAFTPSIASNIQNVQNSLVPTGTILPYAGRYTDGQLNYFDPPDGYLWCDGVMTQIDLYPNLFNVIGHMFQNGQNVFEGFFFLPQLGGAFLKGVGENPLFTNTQSISQVGGFQQANVGNHAHHYKDRGDGNYLIVAQDPSPPSATNIANNTDSMYWTDGYSYDSVSHAQSNRENRPNCVGVNYIIKY